MFFRLIMCDNMLGIFEALRSENLRLQRSVASLQDQLDEADLRSWVSLGTLSICNPVLAIWFISLAQLEVKTNCTHLVRKNFS